MEPAIAIYIGAPLSIGSEIGALCRLHKDLHRVGASATILVNFHADGRQIDCVVVTERQATMLDFKNLNGPIKGDMNGPWMLRDFGGSERRYEGENPYQEVLSAKFALANALKQFHRTTGIGAAPSKGQFVRLLQAGVCVFPGIAPGSSVTPGDFKCRVWSYSEAFTEITTRELDPRWSVEEWTRFAEHLHLEQVTLEAAISPEHREAENTLADYARGLRNDLLTERFPSLPGPSIPVPMDQHVLMIGRSGIGKTVQLRRYARSLADHGRLVLFSSGRHYTDSFDRLLTRAVAPFSTRTPAELISAAKKSAWSVDLIVDGIDGCAESRRRDVIDGVAAFALRYGARVILSSTSEIDLPPGISSTTLKIPALTDDQKLAVYRFHADGNYALPNGFLAAFETAHDIMVAAKSAVSVAPGGSRADYYHAYVFASLPEEYRMTAGALLRHIANHLHKGFVRCMEFAEFERVASSFLKEIGGGLQVADSLTKLQQASVSRELFSFTHDLWQDYFAAEWLLHTTATTEALCKELSTPMNRRLASHAIGRIRDIKVLANVIECTCDCELIADGFAGGLGQQSKVALEKMHHDLWDDLIIDAGTFEIIPADAGKSPDGVLPAMGLPAIMSTKTWSASDWEIATWISERLHQPEIATNFIEVLESSSEALWSASERAANRTKGSVRRIFSGVLHSLGHFLGPTIPLTVFGMFRLWEQSGWVGRLSRRSSVSLRNLLLDQLEDCSNATKVTALFCLAVILRDDERLDGEIVSRVFHLGWAQGIRPLRFQLLSLIERNGRDSR